MTCDSDQLLLFHSLHQDMRDMPTQSRLLLYGVSVYVHAQMNESSLTLSGEYGQNRGNRSPSPTKRVVQPSRPAENFLVSAGYT